MVLALLWTLVTAATAAYAPAAGPTVADKQSLPRVGAALQPCPAGLRTVGVRELRSRPHEPSDCFAVRGRLIATVREGPVCDLRTVSDSSAGGASGSRCVGGWVLADLSDPPGVVHTGREVPTVTIFDGSPYLKDVENPAVRPLLTCNKNRAGKPIMPARTLAALPPYQYAEAAALNQSLRNMTVVAYGGSFNPDNFEFMLATHLCRQPRH